MTEEMEKTDADTEAVGSDTETSEEASSTAEADGKAAALPEEKEVGFGTGEMPEAYSDHMVADSKMSGKVQTKDGEVVYHLPYIDYESTACENVYTQIEKLGNDYMAKAGTEYTDCIAIGYEWSVYQDLLSVVVRVDFDANEYTDFYVYTIDLRKDVLLSKDDVLAYLDIDEDSYEKKCSGCNGQLFYQYI